MMAIHRGSSFPYIFIYIKSTRQKRQGNDVVGGGGVLEVKRTEALGFFAQNCMRNFPYIYIYVSAEGGGYSIEMIKSYDTFQAAYLPRREEFRAWVFQLELILWVSRVWLLLVANIGVPL